MEHITPHRVRMMALWAPTELETAVIKASGLADEANPEKQAEEAEVEEIPENSIWAAHNKDAHGTARDAAEELTEADLVHGLHELGETQESIYRMLVPEVETLFDGADRHQERVEDDMEKKRKDGKKSGKKTSKKSRTNAGSRTDRAAQVFGR